MKNYLNEERLLICLKHAKLRGYTLEQSLMLICRKLRCSFTQAESAYFKLVDFVLELSNDNPALAKQLATGLNIVGFKRELQETKTQADTIKLLDWTLFEQAEKQTEQPALDLSKL